MKLRITSVTLLALALAFGASASASTIYTNGPINGTINAWSFAGLYSYSVADSFNVSASATATSFDAGIWVSSGDLPTTVTWQILTGDPDFLGGTVIATGSGPWSSNVFWGMAFGGAYDVYTSTIIGLNVPLTPGTYWLELSNGSTAQGNNVFWDENDGPSLAYQNVTGQIGSQAFTVYSGTSTPEPGTMLLLGTGLAGAAGMIRRKLML